MNALIPDQSRLLDALMRRDFASFVRKVFHTLNPGSEYQDNWHIRVMCNALEEDWRAYSQRSVTGTGETAATRRLLITVPPRHLKSITVSVAFPAWVLGHDPSKKFLVVSYGGDLALKHARDFRRVVQSGWYQALFPGFGRIARDTAEEVVTSAGGGRLSASVGGALTGLGSDIIVIDDLMKASDANSAVERKKVQDFYEGSLVSRLNAKTAYMMVAIQQRLHEDDLAGYLLDKGSFRHLNLPAIASEDRIYELGNGRRKLHARGEALFEDREPLSALEDLRTQLGPVVFSCQYLQDPTPPEGGLVRWERIQTYNTAPDRDECEVVVQSWDTAMSLDPRADFSVCTTWGLFQKSWHLLDLIREKMEFPTLKARVYAEQKRWRSDRVVIERCGCGYSLLQALDEDRKRRRQSGGSDTWRLTAYELKGQSKEERLAAQAVKLQNGLVKLPAAASWLPDLKRELLHFPQAKHDDQVDSISQFLNWCYLFEHKPGVRRNIVRR